MSHWAEIDKNNLVLRVLVCSDDDQEALDYLTTGHGGRWIKTSYNTHANKHILNGTPLRGNYAGIGYLYDERLDVFIPPQPFPSWHLNEDTVTWEPPFAQPVNGRYWWDEDNQAWVRATTIPEEYRTKGEIL